MAIFYSCGCFLPPLVEVGGCRPQASTLQVTLLALRSLFLLAFPERPPRTALKALGKLPADAGLLYPRKRRTRAPGLGAGRGGGRVWRRKGQGRESVHRGTAPHTALRWHVKDGHVKDAAQDVAQDALGAAEDGDVKVLIFPSYTIAQNPDARQTQQ